MASACFSRDHLVKDLTHVAGQDHVLESDVGDLDAELGHVDPHLAGSFFVDGDLHLEDLVECHGAERLTERLLQRAVKASVKSFTAVTTFTGSTTR